MTAPRDTRVYIEDILQAIENIRQYTKGFNLESFRHDSKTQDAVVRNLEVIGEAVKRIPADVRAAYPDIEWHPAAAMRDFLIHEYPDVDAETVWSTIADDLPPFEQEIARCLSELSKDV